MDSLSSLFLSPLDLAAINQCQLAHRVLFLLDICDGWGHSLHGPTLQAPSQPPVSSWSWPQASTFPSDWNIWACCLHQLLLSITLGLWTHPPTSVFSVSLILAPPPLSFQAPDNIGTTTGQGSIAHHMLFKPYIVKTY